ncbi:polymorphic outer membrane protein middle domain-containing protein, partial [Chlamydia pecorum]
LTGDVSFAHLGETTALTNSCFSNASESLSFLGNGFSLSFDTIKSSAEGAAISVSASDKHLSLSGFSKLSFLSSPTSSSPANNSEKGAIKCGGNVEIADTTSVVFSKNASANDGGAISTKALSLSKNSAVSFSENTVATGKKGGAIYASGQVEISSSLATVSFVNNSAGVSGGAIYTETGCSLIGNNSLVFDSNKATETDGNGGAIYCIAPAASPTNQPSNPAQNNSGGSGSSGGSSAPANSAPGTGGNLDPSQQTNGANSGASTGAPAGGASSGAPASGAGAPAGTPGTPGSSSSSPSPSSPASPPSSPGGTTARVLLGKHASVPAVGAGATAPELILSGNQSLVFTNNSATANGGAIYAKNLTLSSAGTGAFFVNNRVTNATAPKGGAIAIAQSGTISLSAEGGNITFDGNIAHTSGVTPASKRNAIDLADSAKFTNLRATAGNSIFFYDPITSSTTGNTGNTTTDILTINQTDPTTKQEYGGTIVFSGEKLSKEEKAIQDNLNSTFAQAVTLSNGTLALKEGVTLTVNKAFVQEESSLLLMDVGTKLASTTEDITVTNLAINVNSLVSGDPTRRATLEVSGSGKSINLSGPITLTDPYGNAYEQHELGASKVFDFVEFITPAALTTSNFPIAQDTQEHFGHQGTWSILWSSAPTAPGATPIKTTATVTWTKTGYVPNLEQRASLVPNTLWGTFMDMRAVHHLLGICS